MKRLLILFLLTLPGFAFGEETPVYESLRGVRIGPVFLTPQQRRWLDARRGETPSEGAGFTDVDKSQATEPRRKPTPAGFIISSNGKRSQWKSGDFESTSSTTVSAMSFPDDVKIIRHTRSQEQSDDADETRE